MGWEGGDLVGCQVLKTESLCKHGNVITSLVVPMNNVKTVMIYEWMIHIIHIYVINILNGFEYQYSDLITCQMFTNGISSISRFIDQDN